MSLDRKCDHFSMDILDIGEQEDGTSEAYTDTIVTSISDSSLFYPTLRSDEVASESASIGNTSGGLSKPQLTTRTNNASEPRDDLNTLGWNSTLNTRLRTLNTRLLNAIEDHDNEEVKRLLQIGACPDATCRLKHISACHVAALSNGEALQVLLGAGADRQRVDKFGRTPLHFAARAGATWQIAMLLDLPKDLQNKVHICLTPETEAEVKALKPAVGHLINVPAMENEVMILEQWKDSIEHKCKGFKEDLPSCIGGWSPLHVASWAARPHCVRLLLAAGADPNQKDASGRTALDLAGAATITDYDIDENDFVQTITILLGYGGELNTADTISFDSVLHTAVMLASLQALPLLLNAGAPVHHQNTMGYTPLHECVIAQLKEHLQILANHKHPEQIYPTVDVTDMYGTTVLLSSIRHRWVPGVCVALEAGANITLTNAYGDTAIHLAASTGDLDILKEILSAAKLNRILNQTNYDGETPLTNAILSGQLDCVSYLLEEGASLKVTCIDQLMGHGIPHDETKKGNDILHVATSVGDVDILAYLLNYDDKLHKLLHYEVPSLEYKIPLEYAVEKNHIELFKYLHEKTFDNFETHYDKSRLIYVVATFNRKEIFEYINFKWNSNEVYDAINRGFALHKAILYASRDMVIALIKSGADMSQKNEIGQTALSLLMYHLPKATEFMEEIFDSYIYSNDKNIYDRECEITIDYSALMPSAKYEQLNKPHNEHNMNVLEALLETGNRKGQRGLLAHALIESFLFLRWKKLSNVIYIIIFNYAMFLISLNVYIVSVFYHNDNKLFDIPAYYDPKIWKYCIYVTVCSIGVQELFLLNLKITRCLYNIETWIKISTIALATAMPKIITLDSLISVCSRNLATLAVVLSWMNLLILLSWAPSWGYYMQMFGKVSYKVIKIILSYSFLVICFAISFMIQFHSTGQFDSPLAAFIKTVVMMTSEFDYGDIFNNLNSSNTIKSEGNSMDNNTSATTIQNITTDITMLRVVFLLFLVFIAIVLMNLIIGVAVNDLNVLTHKGNLRLLEKQVACLRMLEDFTNNRFLNYLLRSHMEKVKIIFTIKPIEEDRFEYVGRIRELIINKAQSNFDMREKEIEGKRIKTKLDEILELVEKKNKHEDTATDSDDSVIHQDEIEKHLNDLVKHAVENAVAELESKLDRNFELMSTTSQMITEVLDKLNN